MRSGVARRAEVHHPSLLSAGRSVPGVEASGVISLASDHPLCLDRSGDRSQADYDAVGRCTRHATHEVRSVTDGSWGAACDRCAGYYKPKDVRVLTEVRSATHFYLQAQDGGRLR